jgi:hypothetical protein
VKRRPAEQSKLAKLAIRRPVYVSVCSAAGVGAWCARIVGDWRAVLGAAAFTFCMQYYLWRPGGPARRREERLFGRTSPDGDG